LGLLILAVPIGLATGLIRARITGSAYVLNELKLSWLVLIAFIPQLVAFQFSATRNIVTASFAAVALISSQLILLVFAWPNRRQPGFPLLGLGLFMNLAVICLNGGFMPINPGTVKSLVPEISPGTWKSGERFGTGKDIVLAVEETRLWWLSDRFLLPVWIPYRAAYSVGDIFIAAGVFWWLFYSGRQLKHPE